MSFARRPARLPVRLPVRLVVTVALAALAPFAVPACATAPRAPTVAAAGSPRAYVLDRAARHLYDVPVPTLTKEVTAFLSARGYPIRTVAPGAWTRVETDWAWRRGRVVVEVRPAGTGRSRLVARLDAAYLKVPPFETPPRDLPLEWAILRHLEPRTAEAILEAAHR